MDEERVGLSTQGLCNDCRLTVLQTHHLWHNNDLLDDDVYLPPKFKWERLFSLSEHWAQFGVYVKVKWMRNEEETGVSEWEGFQFLRGIPCCFACVLFVCVAVTHIFNGKIDDHISDWLMTDDDNGSRILLIECESDDSPLFSCYLCALRTDGTAASTQSVNGQASVTAEVISHSPTPLIHCFDSWFERREREREYYTRANYPYIILFSLPRNLQQTWLEKSQNIYTHAYIE